MKESGVVHTFFSPIYSEVLPMAVCSPFLMTDSERPERAELIKRSPPPPLQPHGAGCGPGRSRRSFAWIPGRLN